jgi:hypothetical protein
VVGRHGDAARRSEGRGQPFDPSTSSEQAGSGLEERPSPGLEVGGKDIVSSTRQTGKVWAVNRNDRLLGHDMATKQMANDECETGN